MFLQRVFYFSPYLFTASITIALFPNLGSDAVSIPIIKADHEDSVQPRWSIHATASRDSSDCIIFYTWTDTIGCKDNGYYCYNFYENITITGSDGKTNPTSVQSSNDSNLALSTKFNNGYNNWFPHGHACSNKHTQIYTQHRLHISQDIMCNAYVTDLKCDTCEISGLYYFSSDNPSLQNAALEVRGHSTITATGN
jgi:hypothetical protein